MSNDIETKDAERFSQDEFDELDIFDDIPSDHNLDSVTFQNVSVEQGDESDFFEDFVADTISTEIKSDTSSSFVMNYDKRDLGLDLSALSFEEEAEVEDFSADAELIQKLRSDMQDRGYETAQLNYDELNILQEREMDLDNVSYKDLFDQLYTSKYEKILTILTSSRATSIRVENAKRLENFSLNIQRPQGITKDFEELVLSLLKTLRDKETTQEFVSLTAQNIVEMICRSPEKDTYIRLINLGIPVNEYIESCTTQFINDLKQKMFRMQKLEMKRRKTAEFLLSRESKNLKIIKNKSCGLIRKLQRDKNSISYVCPHCGKKSECKNSFITILAIASERKRSDYRSSKVEDAKQLYDAYGFPEVEICQHCGGNNILWWREYERLSEECINYYNNNLAEVNAYLYNMSEGTAFIRIVPKRVLVEDSLYYLIEDSEIVQDSPIMNKAVSTVENYSDAEYMTAISAFYDRLKGITPKSNVAKDSVSIPDLFDDAIDFQFTRDSLVNEGITHKTIAQYFAKVLSQEYCSLKNKALCSILYKLEEFPTLTESLSITDLTILENEKLFLDKCLAEDFIITLEYTEELQKVYTDLYRRGYLQDELYSVEALKGIHKRLSEIIKEKQLQREELKRQLFELETAFSYVKIINLRQIPVFNFYSIFCDKELFEFFDKVTDRMIILHLAKDYCDMLFKQKTINSTTAMAIANVTNTDVVYKKVFAVLKNYVCLSEQSMDYIGQKVSRISLKHLDSINCMVEAFKHCDYYNFVRSVYEIGDTDTLTDQKVNAALRNLIAYTKKVQPIFDSSSEFAYHQFYLSNFTLQDFEALDNEDRRLLQQIKFKRFIPNVENHESLSAYLHRYLALESEDKLGAKNSFDCMGYFDNFKNYFGIMTIANVVYLLECDDYALTVFINELANICVREHNRQDTIMMLGVDDSLLCKIENHPFEVVDSESIVAFPKYYKAVSGCYTLFTAMFFEDIAAGLDMLSVPVDQSIAAQHFDFSIDSLKEKIESLKPEDFIAMDRAKKLKNQSDESVVDELDSMGFSVDELTGLKEDMLNEIIVG